MTQLLRLSDATWPRSRTDLQASYPLTAFPADLSQCDLSDFDHCIPAPTDPPPHDPATQRLEETHPVFLDGSWRQVWEVIDLPPPSPPLPAPDWTRFRATLQDQASGFPEAWNLIFASDSQAGILFIVTLSVWQADPQQWPQFLQATLLCLSRIPVEQQDAMLVKFLTLAEQCHLDPAFLRVLRLIDRRSKDGLT